MLHQDDLTNHFNEKLIYHENSSADLHKGKGKVRPGTGHEGPEGEQMYRSTPSSTSALDGRWVSTLHPGRFTPGKETRYPLHRKLDGPQGRSGRVRKISPPTGIRSSDRPARSQSLYRLSYRARRYYVKKYNEKLCLLNDMKYDSMLRSKLAV